MKKILVLLMMAVVSTLSMFAQDVNPSDGTSLIVWHKDGTQIILNLSEKPKISYVGDIVKIESSTTVEYQFQDIRKMSYIGDLSSDISDAIIEKIQPFTSDGETITFLPVAKDMHVRIVLPNGMVFKEFVVKRNESYTFPLNSTSSKMYMININGVTYKIAIR